MLNARGLLLAAYLLVLLLPQGALSTPVVVTSTSGLEVDFTVPNPLPTAACCGGGPIVDYPADLIDIQLLDIAISGPLVTHVAIYNGNKLLGEGDFAYQWGGIFKSASSLYSSIGDAAPIIDWSSFTDGSLDGRLVITSVEGSFTFSDLSSVRAVLGYGSVNTGSYGVAGNALITSVHAAPEPGTYALAIAGIGMLMLRRLRRKVGSTTT